MCLTVVFQVRPSGGCVHDFQTEVSCFKGVCSWFVPLHFDTDVVVKNVVLAEQTEQHLQNIVLIHHLAVILVCFGQLGQQISAH